jgi:ribosomal protein S19E (S16A)
VSESIERGVLRVLVKAEPAKHIGWIGHAMLREGVVKTTSEHKRHSMQGLALLAGKWLRRLESLGWAVNKSSGWSTTAAGRAALRAGSEPPAGREVVE